MGVWQGIPCHSSTMWSLLRRVLHYCIMREMVIHHLALFVLTVSSHLVCLFPHLLSEYCRADSQWTSEKNTVKKQLHTSFLYLWVICTSSSNSKGSNGIDYELTLISFSRSKQEVGNNVLTLTALRVRCLTQHLTVKLSTCLPTASFAKM